MDDCRNIRVHECSQCGKRFKARGGTAAQQNQIHITTDHTIVITTSCQNSPSNDMNSPRSSSLNNQLNQTSSQPTKSSSNNNNSNLPSNNPPKPRQQQLQPAYSMLNSK
uniref:C2H2-type domain-containing protein n=1 Tax=Ditylenchus dipsaci TaxID=166011 RepID=A0A915CUJ8_9BILA